MSVSRADLDHDELGQRDDHLGGPAVAVVAVPELPVVAQAEAQDLHKARLVTRHHQRVGGAARGLQHVEAFKAANPVRFKHVSLVAEASGAAESLSEREELAVLHDHERVVGTRSHRARLAELARLDALGGQLVLLRPVPKLPARAVAAAENTPVLREVQREVCAGRQLRDREPTSPNLDGRYRAPAVTRAQLPALVTAETEHCPRIREKQGVTLASRDLHDADVPDRP
mmetsp:Transcript_69979/g.195774  ORF Transcript_69979/g.195774 Transcript_69979/m.195774 type:complete len:229 (-) Transcript_69979:577-1263(-)